MESSCLNCVDRKIKCHGECEKYRRFREHMDLISKNKVAETKTHTDYTKTLTKRKTGPTAKMFRTTKNFIK